MNISPTQINQLKKLLEEGLGLKYKDEELEAVALAVAKFVYVKEVQKVQSNIPGTK